MTAALREVRCDEPVARLARYEELVPDVVAQLRELARPLAGCTVLHINATPTGGGVAEMLKDQVPLERELGLDSRWFVIDGAPDGFFVATKEIHNLLQGKPGSLTDVQEAVYRQVNEELAGALTDIVRDTGARTIIIHDPQPMGAAEQLPESIRPTLRLHIDLSAPNERVLAFLQPYLARYGEVIVTAAGYGRCLELTPEQKLTTITPAINPFTDKNTPLAKERAREILASFGINPDKPLIVQVSRFDPWKDPVGVIQAYYQVKNDIPGLQLVLAGIMYANDDPEAQAVYREVQKHAKGDPDIFLFAHPDQLREISNDQFINALQSGADVVVQKSLREGFGLTVTEAMWKSKSVVAGTTTGTLLQIENERNGFLVSSVAQASAVVSHLLAHPAEGRRIGQAARRTVQEQFLLPHLLRAHLAVYARYCKN